MSLVNQSGTPQFQGTVMSMPLVSGRILLDFRQRSIFQDISTTEYTGELQKQGDTIIFRQAPNMTIRDGGYAGSRIRHSQGQFSAKSFRVGRALYYSIAIDPLVADRTEGWDMLEDALVSSAGRNMNEYIDKTVLNSFYLHADKFNRGANAGRVSKSVNLGAPGAPLVISKSSVLENLTNIPLVMAEQNLDVNSDMFLIGPHLLTNRIQNSDLKNASFSGLGSSTYLNSRVGSPIAGLNLYQTNRAPRVWDAVANKWCYVLPFGMKQATAFVAMNEWVRRIEAEAHSWNRYIQQRSCWDFFVLYPEMLGYMYVTFE